MALVSWTKSFNNSPLSSSSKLFMVLQLVLVVKVWKKITYKKFTNILTQMRHILTREYPVNLIEATGN